MQKTAVIDGTTYHVIGEVKAPSGALVVVLDIPMMSDIALQRESLLSRLRNPANYAQYENVPDVVNRLEVWLEAHDPDVSSWYAAHDVEYATFTQWKRDNNFHVLEV